MHADILDIEEITQKAGNYKKFHVFTTMLVSAFNKNSDSVFIDLLTLSDLEILKAKKAGANHPTPSLARSETLRRAQQHKRYLILTYTGEFDRVHFPLPLSFEDTPNAIALQKTVRRLREKLKEKRAADLEPASEREKYASFTLLLLLPCLTVYCHLPPQCQQRAAPDCGSIAARQYRAAPSSASSAS